MTDALEWHPRSAIERVDPSSAKSEAAGARKCEKED